MTYDILLLLGAWLWNAAPFIGAVGVVAFVFLRFRRDPVVHHRIPTEDYKAGLDRAHGLQKVRPPTPWPDPPKSGRQGARTRRRLKRSAR